MKKRQRKIRKIKEGLLPLGPLAEDEVILSPENPPGYLKRHLMAAKIHVKAAANTGTAPLHILARKDINLRNKVRRICAEVNLEATKLLYDPRIMYDAGFRVAKCVCSPGMGHRASTLPIEKKGRAICKVRNRGRKRNKRG